MLSLEKHYKLISGKIVLIGTGTINNDDVRYDLIELMDKNSKRIQLYNVVATKKMYQFININEFVELEIIDFDNKKHIIVFRTENRPEIKVAFNFIHLILGLPIIILFLLAIVLIITFILYLIIKENYNDFGYVSIISIILLSIALFKSTKFLYYIIGIVYLTCAAHNKK